MEKLTDFNYSSQLEWIETNGLGGYASSTVSGANTRKYHGLLVAAMHPPVERIVVLSKLEETIIADGKRFELGANQYPGAVYPTGFMYLKSFTRDLFPEFVFEIGTIKLKKTFVAVNGENTTLILYEVMEASNSFSIELLPLCSARDYHHLTHTNDVIYKNYIFSNDVFQTKNYPVSPELFIAVPQSAFIASPAWYYNFEYSQEQSRGLEFSEDLFSHGKFRIELKKGDKLGIIISTEDPTEKDAFELYERERARRQSLLTNFSWNESIRHLVMAADQFIVKRGDNLKTIIAGYPWFCDWGRDTMISLPGLCLVTNRHDDAKKILKAFADNMRNGLLPNRFPDYGEQPEYNTADATLWFFHAVYKYYTYTSDKTFIAVLLPLLKESIDWHYKGTHYNIHVDSDELLYSGENGVQLTWMDAKVDNWVVTPRKGKAVEINALWHHALLVMAELLIATNQEKEAELYKERAKKVKLSFNKLFWNDEADCLYDFVDGEYKNSDLRPNQLYAVSLPFPLLAKEKAKKVFDIVTKKLLTPRGLRSLSPDHKDYKPFYEGDRWQRDGAYHQGTVWSFLLGTYIDALMVIRGEKARVEASSILKSFLVHLNEAGIGTVSEIFDGNTPHHPRGCIGQAWGVGEILRVTTEYELFPRK